MKLYTRDFISILIVEIAKLHSDKIRLIAFKVREGTTSVEGEMKRRIRISVGNFQQLFLLRKLPNPFTVPFYLIIINYDAFIGLFKYLFRTQKIIWERPQ